MNKIWIYDNTKNRFRRLKANSKKLLWGYTTRAQRGKTSGWVYIQLPSGDSAIRAYGLTKLECVVVWNKKLLGTIKEHKQQIKTLEACLVRLPVSKNWVTESSKYDYAYGM